MTNGEQEREEVPGAEGGPEPADDKATEPKGIVVDLSEDEDDESPGEPTDRKGKRQHFRQLREGLNAEKERNTRLERELAELRGRVSSIQQAPAPAQQQREEADPIDAEMDGIEAQQEALVAQMRDQNISEERFDKLKKQYKQLGRKLVGLAAQKVQREQAPAVDPVAYENQMLQAEFPDVFGDPVKLQEAKTELMKLRRAGKPINIVTAREAASIVAKRYRRPTVEPSAADRARHTSVPSRPGASGASASWSPTKAQYSAAMAFTAHLDNLSTEERLKVWVKKVGKPHGLVK